LKKVTGYIFSRAQKGFTSDRHIQEVLINVAEMISHCKANNIPGAILSIDQAKAFDSISHKYMREVYKFFGFGPNFVKLLETLGNNRTACIAFDDGSFSAPFELECGRAQGNTSSPTEYNMGQQILLFKIELCPEIKSLYLNHFIARPMFPAKQRRNSQKIFVSWLFTVVFSQICKNPDEIFQTCILFFLILAKKVPHTNKS
jgi:hypothetical protein